MPQASGPDPTRAADARVVSITVRSFAGELVESGEVLLEESGPAAPIERRDWSRSIMVDLSTRPMPPRLAILVAGYLPAIVLASDRRWEHAAFEVLLEVECLAKFIVKDRSGAAIANASVEVVDYPEMRRLAEDLVPFGLAAAPTRTFLTDRDGVASVTVGSSWRQVFGNVEAFGYCDERFVRCELPAGARGGTTTVVLGAILAAGLEVVTGREDVVDVTRLGRFSTPMASPSPVRVCGPSAPFRKQLVAYLNSRIATERQVVWAFCYEPADAVLTVNQVDAQFRYIVMPDHDPASRSNVNRFVGPIRYRKITEITDADVAVVDVSEALANAAAQLEIEFIWPMNDDEVPSEESWVVQSLDDRRLTHGVQKRPCLAEGRRHFGLIVSAGRYILRQRRDCLNPIPIDPVEFEVIAGETRRITVARSAAADVGSARFVAQDGAGRSLDEKCYFAVERVEGSGERTSAPFVGEYVAKLRNGSYRVQISVDGRVESLWQPFAVTAGSETVVRYIAEE